MRPPGGAKLEPVSDEYRPQEYWNERLTRDFSLRGTGHIAYSDAYNRWLYRAKATALRRALAGLQPPLRALDVGSGVGWVVDRLRRWGADVDGCDIADVAVQRLRERFPGSTFFSASLGDSPLPVDDATYGLVTLLDVSYHITDDDRWRAAVSDLARVLAPGGRLLATDAFDAVDSQPAPHVRHRSQAAWERAASESGLVLRRVHPLYRWLSRDRDTRWWSRLPDGTRGAIELGLEHVVPRHPHLRIAVLERRSEPERG